MRSQYKDTLINAVWYYTTKRPMEQNRKPKNRSTQLWT